MLTEMFLMKVLEMCWSLMFSWILIYLLILPLYIWMKVCLCEVTSSKLGPNSKAMGYWCIYNTTCSVTVTVVPPLFLVFPCPSVSLCLSLSSPVSRSVVSVLVSLIMSTCILFGSVYLGSCFVSSLCLVPFLDPCYREFRFWFPRFKA